MKKFVLLLGVILPSLLSLPISAEPALTQSVQNAQAKTTTLEEFKGKVVYVDFWASWCGPCRKSFPWMNAMHAKYANQGLAVVAINLDSDKALADKFLALLPAKFHIRFDPEGDAAAAFDLQGMPSSYIFNKQGQLVQSHVGFFEEYANQYEQELVTLLKE
ncbi:TlpA disulfide reductase family protein [Shewanella psychrotolerans]|uniref:TlpA disulfide reductase family protein n=1 Tax=Shewanella psychrotolerans TaxID=2864206 RepID=UPI001C65DAE4|nr:TlpA disulfide reductase family protein [Shewanella psychrotolerans]QYK01627.1 TlpA family protein disulfide reductase [Shewanella psychrotolerans]